MDFLPKLLGVGGGGGEQHQGGGAQNRVDIRMPVMIHVNPIMSPNMINEARAAAEANPVIANAVNNHAEMLKEIKEKVPEAFAALEARINALEARSMQLPQVEITVVLSSLTRLLLTSLPVSSPSCACHSRRLDNEYQKKLRLRDIPVQRVDDRMQHDGNGKKFPLERSVPVSAMGMAAHAIAASCDPATETTLLPIWGHGDHGGGPVWSVVSVPK